MALSPITFGSGLVRAIDGLGMASAGSNSIRMT